MIKTNDRNDIDFVFKSLKEANSKIFIRLVLHLLRLFPKANAELLESFLTNRAYFDDAKIHHEYYLLMQQEFKNLSIEKQNLILKYIDDGPTSEYYHSDDEHWSSEKKKVSWRRHKLEPIRNDLPKDIQDKYKDILFDKDGQELRYGGHPDFLTYFYSAWGTISPVKNDEMKNMSVDDVIVYLKSWKPPKDDGWRNPTIRGLAQSLEKDIK